MYIAFAMEYLGGEPKPDGEEVDAAGFFYSLEEMEQMNVAGFTRWLVDIAMQSQNAAGLSEDKEPIVPLPGNGLYRI